VASVFKAIKPKAVRWGAMRNEIWKGVKEGGEILLEAHQAVTRTWKTPVLFKLDVSRVFVSSSEVYAIVSTKDKRWLWTDKGTKPHKIPLQPKTSGWLAFPSKFSPKSKPGTLRAFSGSKGGPMFFAKQVNHPGTKPRKFSEQIEKKYGPKFRTAVNKAMDRAARVSGAFVS